MSIFDIIKYIIFFIFCIIMFIVFLSFIHIFIMFIKGNKIPKRTIKSKYKKRNIFLMLFYDLPKAIARDFFQRNPDSMNIHGLFSFIKISKRTDKI